MRGGAGGRMVDATVGAVEMRDVGFDAEQSLSRCRPGREAHARGGMGRRVRDREGSVVDTAPALRCSGKTLG